MRGERLSIVSRATLAVLAMALLVTSAWAATEKVLYNFGHGADGAQPYGSLIFDAAGNLYGTTNGAAAATAVTAAERCSS